MYEAYTPNEVAVKLPLEITSLTCQKSCGSVYAGSKVGQLFVYTPKRTSRRGFDLDTLCKQFERKAVMDLSICEEQDLVFCVSDGQMAAHFLKDRHFPVVSILHKIKPVNGFATWFPEDSDTLHIFVSSKKRLFLFKWFDKDFHDVRLDYNQSFADKPNTMRVVGSTLFMSCGREYILMKLTKTTNEDGESWFGDCRRLFDVSDNPSIILIGDRDLLGFSYGDTLIFTNFEGQKTPLADVRFSDVPCDIGYVFVSSPFDVWMLDAHANIRKNVSTLISDKQFELAIQVVEMSNFFTEDNKIEIKRQAALNLFHRRRFEESFQLHAEIKTDVITIIQMFPEFLPEKLRTNAAAFDLPANDKKRALLALGNYLSAVRSDLSKQVDQCTKDRHHSHSNLNSDHLKSLHISLQVVDTALLKCYLQLQIFTILSLALELLHKQFLEPEADPFFHDLDRTISYLQTLGNTHLELIFKYARWVLDKDVASGLEVGQFIFYFTLIWNMLKTSIFQRYSSVKSLT
ncbi:unnamed protein product [Haemonchus placei]|uniref:CNH domain-containing protein n=1 Tax=Haemonchus placei TaxID=6290 RepID=A0A0N4X7Y1_HAEPC|nr:unnamed protein product [Haemonchus placei]